MIRRISHSEIGALLDCQARHDFAYVGQLAGTALTPKATPILLREGRAWGRAVAAWHETGNVEHARFHIDESLDEDAEQQREVGLYDEDEHRGLAAKLRTILAHYTATVERIPLTRLEHELEVAIPSRTGKRGSNAYRLVAFLDGVHTDAQGRDWIVEFKLRKQLTSFELIALDRQTRWYAWAWRQATGRPVAGIIVDERLNAEPAAVRFNQDGRPSKVQTCTVDDYVTAAEDPDPDVVAKLAAKQWHQRHPLILRPSELDEVGWQLISAARLIHELDSGRMFPIRNPSRARCPGCRFRDICPDPADTALADALFDRVPAKRDREEVAA